MPRLVFIDMWYFYCRLVFIVLIVSCLKQVFGDIQPLVCMSGKNPERQFLMHLVWVSEPNDVQVGRLIYNFNLLTFYSIEVISFFGPSFLEAFLPLYCTFKGLYCTFEGKHCHTEQPDILSKLFCMCKTARMKLQLFFAFKYPRSHSHMTI